MNLYEDVFVCHCLFVGPTKTCAFLTLFVVKLSHWVKNIEKEEEEDYIKGSKIIVVLKA
jgi:hypothetical protein